MIGRLRRIAGGAIDRRVAALEQRLVADAARREHELAVAIDELVPAIDQRVYDLRERLDGITRRVDAVDARASALDRRIDDELSPMLRAVVDDESANRRRLWATREQPSYAMAYDEAEPLVSVLMAVRERPELLAGRALPSVLGQSYERLEVVIVGDDATPEVQAIASGTGDPRVSFTNIRGRVVHDDPAKHWLSALTMPRNEAYRIARGRWTLEFDDDDALCPDAVERLLAHARAERAEVAYGTTRQHQPDGTTLLIGGDDPPRRPWFSLGSALVHGDLRFFTREHVAAALGLPGDWYRAERMLRVGVRFSHLEHVVLDYWPSGFWRGGDAP